ncbi:hypothetical protein KHA90_22930 [Flavobacterium psychroterrae]|uniref:Uncharacterized protein n=1 Tax=Flavobacterium psychroterrae TaxID=2133767 RepID=A0ABS5PJA0_9FLAO|nr:hypothetical protein [Flavobacterium psychroterrae]MBS7233875.1 hypothetical protein [Flavobacterium psychroterrae]
MEITESKKLENLKKIIEKYFNLNSDHDTSEFYTAQIKINYYELGCVITNMLKMCILTLENEGHIKSSTNKNPVNVSLILEMVLEMFPLNEFEFLGEINEMVVGDLKGISK